MGKTALQPPEMVKLEDALKKYIVSVRFFQTHMGHNKSKRIDKTVFFSTTEKTVRIRKVIIVLS